MRLILPILVLLICYAIFGGILYFWRHEGPFIIGMCIYCMITLTIVTVVGVCESS